jgi:hypothetical protein
MKFNYKSVTMEQGGNDSRIAVLTLANPIPILEGSIIDPKTQKPIFKTNVTEVRVHESIFDEKYPEQFNLNSDGSGIYDGNLGLQLSRTGNVWLTDLIFGSVVEK